MILFFGPEGPQTFGYIRCFAQQTGFSFKLKVLVYQNIEEEEKFNVKLFGQKLNIGQERIMNLSRTINFYTIFSANI